MTRFTLGGKCGCFVVSSLTVLGAVLAFDPHPARGEDSQCLECHADVYESVIRYSYAHPLILKKECLPCHTEEVDDDTVRLRRVDGREDRGEARGKAAGIHWFAANGYPLTEQWYRIPRRHAERGIVIREGWAGSGQREREIILSGRSKLPEIPRESTPPRISGVEVGKVSGAVLISTTISWQTDEMADGTIQYGENSYRFTSSYSPLLSRSHRVTLSGLAEGRNYQYKIISRDVWGNRAVSAPHSFSTTGVTAVSPASGGGEDGAGPVPGAKVTSEFATAGETTLVRIKASEPVLLSLGYRKAPSRKRINMNRALSDRHVALLDPYETNYGRCYQCHQGESHVAHPVHVAPTDKVTVSEEYPLLPDGKIGCRTCHEPHAGNNLYLTIKSSMEELCVGCHGTRYSHTGDM